MGAIIKWKTGSRHKVKAEDAFRELERVRIECGGLVSPQDIVDAAADPEAVLHPEFEWHDELAANEWRKQQARGIVQSLRIVQDDGSEQPAIVSVKILEDRGYQPIAVAFEDSDSHEFVIAEARAGLLAWRTRFRSLAHVPDFSRVMREIDSLLGDEAGA